MNIRTGSAPTTVTLPGEPPRRTRTTLLAVLIVAALVAIAVMVVVNVTGDGSGPVTTQAGDTPPGSVATSPTLPADPQAATKAAVIAAYTQSYQAFIAVGKEASPDINDPRLSQHTTGTALIAKQRALADSKSKGLVFTGNAVLHPTVIQLGPDTATVVNCALDRTALVHGRTGSTIIGEGSGGTADTATLILESGVWKVNHFKDEKTSCVPPAA